jgi:hypothetical protein
MPHSLRAKLSGLRYKGILEDKDYNRLCKALDNEDVLEKIKAEIEQEISNASSADYINGLNVALMIINEKYR